LVFKQRQLQCWNIDNKGIELLAEVIAIRTTEWRIGGNVTFQNSKITKLTTVQPIPGLDVGEIWRYRNDSNHQVGYSPSSFYVYEQAYGADAKPLDGFLLTEQRWNR
jgi:iron complex outermembrane receptor protein